MKMLIAGTLGLLPFLVAFSLPPLVAQEEKEKPPPKFDEASIEFFEKSVRPILTARCYQCHSGKAKKLQGGLRLDSRAAALTGGDTGPALVAGKPKESLLVDAINHGDLYQMPPKTKLPAKEIAALTKWVELGAPWPAERGPLPGAKTKTFDLLERRANHWSWRRIARVEPPRASRADWPADPLDHFILTKLDAAGLTPSPTADKRTLIRRAFFDLVGLPPTPAQVDAFLQDDSPNAFVKVVDRLLKSPHFGERWSRHWLDLVRYAESRGHEFDYDTPNAYHYRDYVIRALNADVPYDQFVREHIAGDLLEKPRLHPEEGFNESVIGTAFWFLGEWVHSPVDIRQDEADRFDNMIDVFSKTFLGLTVACARCHDHKFDAIAQADYYALAGFLQSSAYRQVRFDSLHHNLQLARQARELRRRSVGLAKSLALAQRSVVDRMADYLLASRRVIAEGVGAKTVGEVVFEDFERGYGGWKVEGEAFGDAPQTLQTIAKYQGKINAVGKFFVNSHNIRPGGDVRRGDQLTGRMTSREFTIERRFIQMWVGGGSHQGKTCVNLLVDGKVARTATGRNNNQMFQTTWDVENLRGSKATIQIVDDHRGGWGNVGVDQIVFTDGGEPRVRAAEFDEATRERILAAAKEFKLDAAALSRWTAHLLAAQKDAADPLHAFALAIAAGKDLNRTFDELSSRWKDAAAKSAAALQGFEVIADFEAWNKEADTLLQDGVSFGVEPIQTGELLFGDSKERPLIGVASYSAARRDPMFHGLRLASGVSRDAGRLAKWDRAGRTIRTSTFEIKKPGKIFFQVRGRGLAYVVVDSHRMLNGPLHGSLTREFNTGGKVAWVEHNMNRYAGHRAHVEFTAIGDDDLQVLRVGQAASPPGNPTEAPNALLQQLIGGPQNAKPRTIAGLAKRYAAVLMRVSRQMEAGALAKSKQRRAEAMLADWMIRHDDLFRSSADDPRRAAFKSAGAAYAKARGELAGQVKHESRTAPGMWDGSGEDEWLLIRGNHRTRGDRLPRRLLSAISGSQPRIEAGSGRLQLAERVLSRRNPYTSRVLVNRVWHHLTGRGIVPSTDNFGVLGQRPTHPELLDHLAERFMTEGWSLKRMIRTIMLSRTYQMSSKPRPDAAKVDPNNQWLHRMRIRRLEGEAIRDAMLAVSGRLDPKVHGPSIPVYLTPFMNGRGRPRTSGPLDGAGRRSIYTSVRRNFLPPMMLAFDTPQPFSSVGRRTVSNVPAQALIMMNDPFIVQQAGVWAKRALDLKDMDGEKRVRWLYETAFSRPPTDEELNRSLEFLALQAKELGLTPGQAAMDPRIWQDLCHVLVNVKDFTFLH